MSADNLCHSSKKTPWTEADKWTLLRALKKYGHDDLDNISEEFPEKSKAAVKTMINKLRLAADKCAVKKESQIDAWINSGLFSESDDVIPQALKFISIFEKQPSPSESAGCNFQALYDVLARATLGYPPIDAPEMTYKTIFYILKKVTNEVWPAIEIEMYQYINSIKEEKRKKVYPPKKMTQYHF